MIIDVSHISDQGFWQVLEASSAPVFASHSSARALHDHPRNLIHFPGKKYLFSSAHNVNITGYTRVNDWNEVAEIFLG